jgi:hypothetical protein
MSKEQLENELARLREAVLDLLDVIDNKPGDDLGQSAMALALIQLRELTT